MLIGDRMRKLWVKIMNNNMTTIHQDVITLSGNLEMLFGITDIETESVDHQIKGIGCKWMPCNGTTIYMNFGEAGLSIGDSCRTWIKSTTIPTVIFMNIIQSPA